MLPFDSGEGFPQHSATKNASVNSNNYELKNKNTDVENGTKQVLNQQVTIMELRQHQKSL